MDIILGMVATSCFNFAQAAEKGYLRPEELIWFREGFANLMKTVEDERSLRRSQREAAKAIEDDILAKIAAAEREGRFHP